MQNNQGSSTMHTPDFIVNSPFVRIVSAWAAVGVSRWIEYAQLAASCAAFVYSCLLIWEFIYKKRWFRK